MKSKVKKDLPSFKSKGEVLFLKFKKDILDGNLKPGTVLNQTKISSKYNISRIPVRDSIIKDPKMSIDSIAKENEITRRLARDCIEFLNEIGYYNCSKCDIWKARYEYLLIHGREMSSETGMTAKLPLDAKTLKDARPKKVMKDEKV